MNILILGAGQVGSKLAEHLVREMHNITIIDLLPEKLQLLQSRFDIGCVTGHCAHPSTLRQAGIDNADMIIAVTNSDEINMVACQVASTLFQTPTKIARVRSARYLAHQSLFQPEAFPIDFVISPEEIVTEYIQNLIAYPRTLQVLNFADNRVQLIAVKAHHGGNSTGKKLLELENNLNAVAFNIVAIYRQGSPITITDDTLISDDDEVFFICARQDIERIMAELISLDRPYKRIIIAGGGNIGMRLAMRLEKRYQVKLIEKDPVRAHYLSESLSSTTVLLGDCADRDLLSDENIEHTDVFCAMSNNDEVNILSAMQAKRLGVRQVMAIVTRNEYVDLIDESKIDIAISPQHTTIGSILTHLRQGDIVNVHSLHRGAAEAIEVIVHGDEAHSKVIGHKLMDIPLPPHTKIGALVRENEIIIGEHAAEKTVLAAGDHVIIFLSNTKYLSSVENLFQVSATFV